MCNGIAFLAANGFGNTVPFAEAANTREGFDSIPPEGGVYCLSVSQVGDRIQEAIAKYRASPFFQALARLADASEEFFRGVGCGEGWGWVDREFIEKRLARLPNIFRESGERECPVLYIGRSNNLQERMRQLLRLEHTANHPFWALLNGGWKFDLSFRLVTDERGEEARLKEEYKGAHGGELPPLMER